MQRSTIMRGASLLSFCISLVASGCASAPERMDPVATASLRDDAEYMKTLFAQKGGREPIKIDLGDDRQFRFLESRLRKSGIDAETAPTLFEGLMAARERAVAIKNGTLPFNEVATAATAADRCGVYIVNTQLDGANFKSMARGSCIDGATYSYIDHYQYDEDSNVLAFDFREEWNKGIATDLHLSSAPSPGKGVWADGVVYQETGTTTEAYFYSTGLYTNHIPDAQAAAMAPGPYSMQAFNGPDLPVNIAGTLDAPKDMNGNGTILLCLERNTGSSDCDYKHTSPGSGVPCSYNKICQQNTEAFPVWNTGSPSNPNYDNNSLYVPMAGSALGPAYKSINPWVIEYARAWLTMRTPGSSTPAGGFCEGKLFETGIGGAPYVSLGTTMYGTVKTVTVDIAPFAPSLGNGNWSDYCIDNGKQVDLDIEIKLRQQSCIPSDTNSCGGPVYNWTTRPDTVNPIKPPMVIYWGCLPAGTEITLADGSRSAIEKIAVGQKVKADESGRMLTVVDVVEGTERKPMVRVVSDRAGAVTMTSTHAVPIGDGRVVQAQELQVGDHITTKDGPATVLAVERPKFEGAVYNLVLGTPEELAGGKPNQTTMYANGMLVGDSRLQGAVVQARAESAGAAEIPAKFKKDYELSMLRGKRSER